MQAAQDRYDAFAYPGLPYPQTHPGQLATMAILHGLTPAPVESCRVLEIACGDGSNLIPMAYGLPGSEFVGFDLARLPVERAQARIRDLSLANIRIFQADLLQVDADLGRFDYVIAHGLYSWAPIPVRDRLIGLLSEVLAPGGIAFVSYNAFPGSYVRLLIRDMMMFPAPSADGPQASVAAGQEFLRWVAAAMPEAKSLRPIVEEKLRRLERRMAVSIYHDDLNPEYHPVYFTQFVEHARKYGLEYLADSELPAAPDPGYRADVAQAIEAAHPGDIVRKEQTLDFIRMRPYRETLLCRADRQIRRDYFPESLLNLRFASRNLSRPAEKPGARIIESSAGTKMETDEAGMISFFEALGRAWPSGLGFRELMPLLGDLGAGSEAAGALFLYRLVISRMIEVRSWSPPVAEAVSARPKASACTRQALRLGVPPVNLLHRNLDLDDQRARSLVLLLDGKRTHGELAHALHAEFPDAPVSEIEQSLPRALQSLNVAAVLER